MSDDFILRIVVAVFVLLIVGICLTVYEFHSYVMGDEKKKQKLVENKTESNDE